MSDNEESETEVAPTIKGPKLNKNGKPKKKYHATPEKLAKLAEARVILAAKRAANPSNTKREKELKKQEKELRAKNLEIREEAVRKLQAKLTKNPTTVLTGTEDQIEDPVEDIEEEIVEVKKPKKDKKKKVVIESESESSEDESDSEDEVTLTKKELKALLKKKEKKSKKISEKPEKIVEEKIVVARSNSFNGRSSNLLNGRPPTHTSKPNTGLTNSASDLYNSLFAKPKYNL